MSTARGIKVFISYSSKDSTAADLLFQALSRAEMIPFAFKHRNLAGQDYTQKLHYGISEAHFLSFF